MYIELTSWANFWGFPHVLINENKEIHFASGTCTLIENRLESMVL